MNNRHRLGLWTAIGVGIGAAVGVALHDWITGAGIGAAFAAAITLLEMRLRAK